MRNFLIIALIATFLTACAGPVTTSQPTATLVPSTATPVPTHTPAPATEAAPVISELTPEMQLDSDAAEFGLNLTNYETSYNGDGLLEVRGKTGELKGKLLYRDGAWNADHVADVVRETGVCMQTEFKVDPSGKAVNLVDPKQQTLFRRYEKKLVIEQMSRTDEFKKFNPWPRFRDDVFGPSFNYAMMPWPLKDTDQCWLFLTRPRDVDSQTEYNFVTFEGLDGKAVGAPMFKP